MADIDVDDQISKYKRRLRLDPYSAMYARRDKKEGVLTPHHLPT
jgi:hypothetical protein